MRVVFTEPALQALDNIFAYIARDSPRAATRVVDRIERTAARLGEFPKLGRIKYGNVRMIGAGRYPFLVFYVVEDDEVRIVAVRHARQRLPRD